MAFRHCTLRNRSSPLRVGVSFGCQVGVIGRVPEPSPDPSPGTGGGPGRGPLGEASPALSGLRSPPPCCLHGPATRCLLDERSRIRAAALSLPTRFASSELVAEVDVAVLMGEAMI